MVDFMTQTSGANTPTVYQALRAIADRRPQAIALIFEDKPCTYRQLIDQVDTAAARLHGLGIRRGQSIAVFSQNRPEYVTGFFAAAKIGAVFVPMNFNLTAPEVGYIIEHSEAKLLFRDDRVPDLAELNLPAGVIRTIDELRLREPGDTDPPHENIDPTSDLLIAYTSGTTAAPKAVVLDHASQIQVSDSLARFWELSQDDVTIVGAPFGFLLGLSTVAAASLLRGAAVVILRRFHPGEALEAMVRYRVSIFNGVPTMFQMMLQFAEQEQRQFDLSEARALICSGAPMSEELRRRFASTFSKSLQNYFGMTESYPLFGRYTSDTKPAPEGAAGRVAPGAEIRVFDESGKDCQPGTQGELFVRGPATIKRYHKNPELTAASFTRGLFKTGDLGFLDSDGYVYLTGRAKDIIKRGGMNVAPAEVEGALMQHPQVESVAVVGVPDEVLGEVPVAYIVCKGERVPAEVLITFAAARLAKYKVPAHVRYLEEMPLGKTGKIDKGVLKSQWASATMTG
jgi:long-chain acyl-CoA synthetase